MPGKKNLPFPALGQTLYLPASVRLLPVEIEHPFPFRHEDKTVTAGAPERIGVGGSIECQRCQHVPLPFVCPDVRLGTVVDLHCQPLATRSQANGSVVAGNIQKRFRLSASAQPVKGNLGIGVYMRQIDQCALLGIGELCRSTTWTGMDTILDRYSLPCKLQLCTSNGAANSVPSRI